MVEQSDLIFEIGTEELPPKALKTLSNALAESVTTQLADLDISFKQIQSFATPKRLSIAIFSFGLAL